MSAKTAKSKSEKLVSDDGLTQSERFMKAAQELGTDDDPERFKERVRKLAQTKINPQADALKADDEGR